MLKRMVPPVSADPRRIVGVGAVALTGLPWLDPVIALAVALNIVVTGYVLVRRSAHGLMDAALPDADQTAIRAVLDRYRAEGIEYHALRPRQAGARGLRWRG